MSHQNFITSSQSAWYFAREKFLASLLVRSSRFFAPRVLVFIKQRGREWIWKQPSWIATGKSMRGIKICGQIRGFVLKIDGEEIITDPSEKIQSVLSSKKLQCETCANLINIWKRKTVSTKSIRVHLLISRGFLQLNGPLMGFVLIATTRAVNNGYNTRGDQ